MERKLDRRRFGQFAGGMAVGLAAPGALLAQASSTAEMSPTVGPSSISGPSFPEGFRWGVATAAYQIEGSPDADGKGPSIWDTYAHIPGKMKNGDTGDVAIDHYNRYRDDIALIRDIGANAYRFSISWPRVFPQGTGSLNEKGLDFYSRLVDAQLEAGIEPFATLYHWDLPQALQDRGGWQSRDTAEAFADYAGVIAGRLGDRIKHIFTLNELQNFVEMGHQGRVTTIQGKEFSIELAPALKLSQGELNQVAHHAVLAHGLSVQAIRANGPNDIKVGPADVLFCAVPAIDRPDYVSAAAKATKVYNWRFLDVMLSGRYADDYLASAGADAPKFTDADLAAIASPLDFVGMNLYLPRAYTAPSDAPEGYREIRPAVSHPKMASFWHSFSPEAMYWGPKLLHEIWKPQAIYITENGCAAADEVQPDGQIYDTDRVMYLRAMMSNLARAVAEGVPVQGSFVWSAFDNLEWTDGFGTRFGLIHVDFATQMRTPKMSAAWFREAALRNAVV